MANRFITAAVAAAGLLAASAPAWAVARPALTGEGVWRNPHDSVHIALRPCGLQICGYVVWASPHAEEKARKGGTPKLVGRQLLRDFVVDRDGIGHGKVFVPDLNNTFSGSAQLVDTRTLRARGCLFANLICKTQVWIRIDNAPAAA